MKHIRLFRIGMCALLLTGAVPVYAASQIRINEIMYNAPEQIALGKNLQWIEVYNPGPQAITVIGGIGDTAWTITDSAGTHYFARTAYQGTMTVDANGYAIFAGDAQAFKQTHQSFQGTIIDVGIRLRTDQDMLQLRDATGKIISQTFWSSALGGAGNGKTLEYSSIDKIFREGLRAGGSPGAENSVEGIILPPAVTQPTNTPKPTWQATPSPVGTIRAKLSITEIFTTTQKDQTQWIEVKNDDSSLINLAGWKLSIGSQQNQIALSGNIPALSYAVFDARQYAFKMNTQSDTISLIDPQGRKVFEVTYASAIPAGWSADRFGANIWKLSARPTPGKDNVLVMPEPANQTDVSEIIPPYSFAAAYQPEQTNIGIAHLLEKPTLIAWASACAAAAACIFIAVRKKFIY